MTRAERRWRRERKIAHRTYRMFKVWKYEPKYSREWDEPGRLAKRHGTCGCKACRRSYWETPERVALQDALEEYELLFRKRNRVFRAEAPWWAKRGGALIQHRPGKKVPGPLPRL